MIFTKAAGCRGMANMRMQSQDNTEVQQRGVPTTSQRIEELKQYIYCVDVVGLIKRVMFECQ